MSELVPAEEIEQIVGIARHRKVHFGRAVSAEQTVYILHSKECLDSGIDLRECRFSIALDQVVNTRRWSGYWDTVVALGVWDGELIPIRSMENES